MATYVIGDLQGCYSPLRRLLDQLHFDPAHDHLWFAGDLVSRGQQSLQTLRFAQSLGQASVSVLGNHDISLIAAAYGVFPPHKSLHPLFNAPDFAELLAWLRQCPLLHVNPALQAIMVHAGIPPAWDLATAQTCAHEAETCLQQNDPTDWLKAIYGDKPDSWAPQTPMPPLDRQRYIINAFTRMRYCYPDGRLEFQQKLGPESVKPSNPELIPWFLYPQRKKIDEIIYFGHWSTLGYYQNEAVTSLDTGCVWGGSMTAVRIDTGKRTKYQVACTEYGR